MRRRYRCGHYAPVRYEHQSQCVNKGGQDPCDPIEMKSTIQQGCPSCDIAQPIRRFRQISEPANVTRTLPKRGNRSVRQGRRMISRTPWKAASKVAGAEQKLNLELFGEDESPPFEGISDQEDKDHKGDEGSASTEEQDPQVAKTEAEKEA